MTNPMLMQTLLWFAAGVMLVFMLGRRRKRKVERH
jgi:hypothetical protein